MHKLIAFARRLVDHLVRVDDITIALAITKVGERKHGWFFLPNPGGEQ